MILKDAKIFDANMGFIEKDIQVAQGRIEAIGECTSDSSIYEFRGCYITPGLIDAHSHIGMWEEGIGIEGADGNENSDPITPQMRGIDGFNPFDSAIKEALKGGVTCVSAGPGSTNVIGGQFFVAKLFGSDFQSQILKSCSAMKCAFGENPKKYFGTTGKAPITRMGISAMLRQSLHEAQDYMKRKEAAGTDVLKRPPYAEKLECLEKVLRKEIPLKVHAHRADDILSAIRIGREFDIELTLDHCTEGHLIVEEIKKSGFSAIVGPTFGFKSKPEVIHKSFETLKILNEAGIKVAIMTDHPVLPQHSLIHWGTFALKEGLSEMEVLKALTQYPAEILGIEHRVGVIKKGLDADLVVWDKHPLDIGAKVILTLVEGKAAYSSEKLELAGE